MSSPKIQRGIQSPHARNLGDAPKVGRISKLRSSDSPSEHRHRDGRSEDQLEKRGISALLASVVLGLVTLGVLSGFVFVWLKSHNQVNPQAIIPTREKYDRIESRFTSPSEDEAISLVKRALAVQTPTEIARSMHSGKASQEEILEFFKTSNDRDGQLENTRWLSSIDVANLPIEGVIVSYSKGDQTNFRLAMLVPDEKGVWKMDFDAFARSCRPSWEKLIHGDATQAEVRVFVTKDSYFNGPFIDESQWVCYGMISPETAETLPEYKGLLRGYCKVGSPQAMAMKKIITAEIRINRATLVVQRRKGADIRQFEITRVLAQDWVIGPDALDKKAR